MSLNTKVKAIMCYGDILSALHFPHWFLLLLVRFLVPPPPYSNRPIIIALLRNLLSLCGSISNSFLSLLFIFWHVKMICENAHLQTIHWVTQNVSDRLKFLEVLNSFWSKSKYIWYFYIKYLLSIISSITIIVIPSSFFQSSPFLKTTRTWKMCCQNFKCQQCSTAR